MGSWTPVCLPHLSDKAFAYAHISFVVFRSYGRCRALLRKAKLPSQICIATDHECFYVSLAAEFHMYLAVPRGISTGVIGQFYQWVKSQEAHIFVGQFPGGEAMRAEHDVPGCA